MKARFFKLQVRKSIL